MSILQYRCNRIATLLIIRNFRGSAVKGEGGSHHMNRIRTGKSHLPRRHTCAKFSKSNIPLSGVGNFNGTASMVSMVGGPGK